MKIARVAAIIFCAYLAWPVGEARLNRLYPLKLYSHEGILIREFRNAAGGYGSALPLEKYPADLVRAVLLAEDARFLQHPGIDVFAIARALGDNLWRRKIRSGASTIPQQLARTVFADLMPENRWLRKLSEILIAVKLSLTHSKAEILEAYLNQVPMPRNSSGLAAAAQRIFGKGVDLLSAEESVALAVIVSQGHLGSQGFEHKFRKLWKKLYPEKVPDLPALAAALKAENPPVGDRYPASEHFIQWLNDNRLPAHGSIRTGISAGMNAAVQRIVSNELRALREAGAEHAAVIVIEKTAGDDELRAMVGSADFLADNAGELNHTVRVRSAGSTLKPFVYGLGFDRGIFNATTIFSDRELTLGTGREGETYRPHNNDMRFWGELTLRESLVASRNVPAIIAADKIGIPALLGFLRQAGFTHLTETAEHYGPGLALGSGGATLLQLARGYAAIAGGGELRPLALGHTDSGQPIRIGDSRRLLSQQTAERLTDMLSDRALRRRAFGRRNFLDFPFPVAAKTGTSKDYRDGWVVGFTPHFVVAVWVGNSHGEPMRSVSGAWGAGRIFHQVMRLVNGSSRQAFGHDKSLTAIRLCRRSGRQARENCPAHRELVVANEKTPAFCPLKHSGTEKDYERESPVVASPVSGERYILNPHESAARQEIPIIIRPAAQGSFSYALGNEAWKPVTSEVHDFRRLTRGDYTLRIFDGKEITEEIEFSVR